MKVTKTVTLGPGAPGNVQEIVELYLKLHGFDGLCCDGCGCFLEDLMPCMENAVRCEPGFKVACGDCPYLGTGDCVNDPIGDDRFDYCVMKERPR